MEIPEDVGQWVLSGGCALVIGWSALPVAAVLVLGGVWGFSVLADSAQLSTMVTEVGIRCMWELH